MDDFSTDTTFQILEKKYSDMQNIKLYRNSDNLGLTKSLNYLIKKSRGELIARQDADDISLPDRFKTQVRAIDKYNLDFCTTRATRLDNKKYIPGLSRYIPKKISIKIKNPFIHGTLMIKKNAIKEIGYYDEKFYFAQDYKLFIDLISKGYQYKDLRKPYYILNTDNNISSNYKKQQEYYSNCARNKIEPQNWNIIKRLSTTQKSHGLQTDLGVNGINITKKLLQGLQAHHH